MSMKKALLLILPLGVLFLQNGFAQNFEGRSRVTTTFNNIERTKEEKKDIWYVKTKDEYYKHEEHLFDTCNIAYFHDSLSKVMDEQDQAIFKQTGVDYGFYHECFMLLGKNEQKNTTTIKIII